MTDKPIESALRKIAAAKRGDPQGEDVPLTLAELVVIEDALMRLEDLLPAGTEAEWTCGHVGGAHCAECYRILARRAAELAEENLALREELAVLGVLPTLTRR